MSFEDKLKSAGYELIAPEKNELLLEVKKLNDNNNQNDSIEESIKNLLLKIKESKTGKERYILEEQLKEIKKLKNIYINYKKLNITNTTKKQINNIFNQIPSQINLTKNIIDDDLEKIKKLIQNEKNRLKDTIDITGYNTIRDLIEDNVDIQGVRESISPQKYQDFFDLFTIGYINFLEKKIGKKLNKKEYEYILQQKGLLINKKELTILITKLIIKINKNYNFKIIINTTNGIRINKVLINLKQFRNIKKEEKKDSFKKQSLDNNNNNANYEKLSTEEKMKHITEILNNKNNEKLLLSVINKLKNKVISVNHKKIKFTQEFINKNKNQLLENLKTIILMIIHIESDGNYKARNIQKSSGKGIGQWLDGNGGFSTEYMLNKKWYSLKQLQNKHIIHLEKLRKRTVWHTSSFGTTLKEIYKGYPDILLNNLKFKVPKKYNKKVSFSPLNLNLNQQIELLILDIGINGKTVKNGLGQKVGIKDFMGTALLGNSWAIKEIYKIFHHTRPDKKTLNRIKNISPKYTKKLIKLY